MLKYEIAELRSGIALSVPEIERRIKLMIESGFKILNFEAQLNIALEGYVEGHHLGNQELVMTINDKTLSLPRKTVLRDSGLCASCQPVDRAPIGTINIAFLDHVTEYCDRGLVWVHFGQESKISLRIYPAALKSAGKLTDILVMAEAAVEEQLLSKFDLTIEKVASLRRLKRTESIMLSEKAQLN